MTDEDVRRIATAVVDELLGRLASRPANDTRPRVQRRQRVEADPDASDLDVEKAAQALRRRGIAVR